MQSPAYNLEYAEYLAKICANCGITSAEVEQAKAKGSDAVLALVNTDEWGFGSAAWFLATQCTGSVREGLKAGTEQGWEAYLSECVGTSATGERTALWRRAVALKEW